MNNRRIGASLLAAGLLTLTTAAPALAEEATVTIIPAQPGTADAAAVELGPIKIGHASAQAGPEGSASDSSATGNAVEVDGEPLAGQFTSSKKGKGGSGVRNQLINLAQPGRGSIRVAPSDADVQDREGGGTRASSSAALLEIIGEGLLRIDVARGEATAEHDGKDSKGFAQSDGARVYLGPGNELELIVLHAEARSDNTGETYLVGINGNKIGSGDDISQCPLSVPQIADVSINCVAATGGNGALAGVTASAVRLGIVPAGGQGLAASSASNGGAAGSSAALAAAPAPAPAPAELPASAPDDSGLLPRTGSDAMALLAAAGAAMALLGSVILGLGRRVSLP